MQQHWVSSTTPKVVLVLLSCFMLVFRSRSRKGICQRLTGRFLHQDLIDLQCYPFEISKSALSTLKSIHRVGVLHGDVRETNILISDLRVTIIDFGHSEQCDDQETKDEELAQLRSCLGLEGKH